MPWKNPFKRNPAKPGQQGTESSHPVNPELGFTEKDWWEANGLSMEDVTNFSLARKKGLLNQKEIEEIQNRINSQLIELGLDDLKVSVAEAFGILVDVYLHEDWAKKQPGRKQELTIIDIVIWRHVNRIYRDRLSIAPGAVLSLEQQKELTLWVKKFFHDRVGSKQIGKANDNYFRVTQVAHDFEDLVKKQAVAIIKRTNRERDKRGEKPLSPQEEAEKFEEARKQCKEHFEL